MLDSLSFGSDAIWDACSAMGLPKSSPSETCQICFVPRILVSGVNALERGQGGNSDSRDEALIAT
ncbi:MAG: hypothetical protein DMG41_29255 [Acidobacteria bacterium]|nr:MAG: hypothetical protein DMG41_29255 [Acidobacteriota bacterium]